MRTRVVRWLIKLVPDRWRESVEGDLLHEDQQPLTLGALGRLLMIGLRLRWEDHPGFTPKGLTMDRLRLDVAHAIRSLRVNRGYALAAVLTLAVGIGANSAVFSLAHWLLLRPVPGIAEPGQVVALSLMAAAGGRATLVSNAELEAMRTVAQLAGYQEVQLNLAVGQAPPRRLPAAVVSDNYFDVLGGAIAMGRAFTREEGTTAAAAASVVISHDLWVNAFNRSPTAVGQTLTLNGSSFTIVGVAVPGFRGTSRAGLTQLWVPIGQHRIVLPMYRSNVLTSDTASIFFGLVARLDPGTTQFELASRLNAVRDARLTTGNRRLSYRLIPREGAEPTPWMRDRVRRLVLTLVGGVVLLLALTCANAGNLILARASGRRAEVATRLALGATRWSVARLLLVESALLAGAAGIVALGMTWALGKGTGGTALVPNLVTLGEVSLDVQVFGFALGLSILVALAAGVAPAIGAARLAPAVRLRDGGRGVSASRLKVRRMLTVAQVAASVALLLGAALLVRSMHARTSIPLGFDPSRVLSVSVEPALQRYTPQRTDDFYRELMTRVRQVPGIRAAGLAWLAPFGQGASDTSLWAEGMSAESAVSANHNMVSPGYLAALGIPLIEGRDFEEAEFLRPETPGTGSVILTQSTARRLFGDVPAVGRRVVMRYPEGRVRTIVGVIPDQRHHRVMDEHAELVLEPFGQSFPTGFASIQLGLAASPDHVLNGVNAVVRELDPTLPVYDVFTLDAAIRRSMTEELLVARSLTVFAVLAMFVAGVGLAGVLARAVAERQREFGVRLACGATPGRLAGQVTREALWLTGIGLAVGLLLSYWFVRIISARLYGVSSTDPWSIAAVIGAVFLFAITASLVPARRAARVDPAVALR